MAAAVIGGLEPFAQPGVETVQGRELIRPRQDRRCSQLRGLFERFNEEAVLTAMDAAVKDAARTPKLLSPLY
jgi:hypothetical protein